jgi:diacylglycerol kinase (ATP)
MLYSPVFFSFLFLRPARSISEEFGSEDAARFREDEFGTKAESSTSSGAGPSSSGAGHSKSDTTHKSEKDRERKDKEKEERDEETIKVFDGNCSLRRRIFRAITVARQSTLEQLLTSALRAFHIARDPNVSVVCTVFNGIFVTVFFIFDDFSNSI